MLKTFHYHHPTEAQLEAYLNEPAEKGTYKEAMLNHIKTDPTLSIALKVGTLKGYIITEDKNPPPFESYNSICNFYSSIYPIPKESFTYDREAILNDIEKREKSDKFARDVFLLIVLSFVFVCIAGELTISRLGGL